MAKRLFVAFTCTYTGMTVGLVVTVKPVTGVAVVTLFAPVNVALVALTLPHDKFPEVSLSSACPEVVGMEVGKVKV